jgi:hypothetical protein
MRRLAAILALLAVLTACATETPAPQPAAPVAAPITTTEVPPAVASAVDVPPEVMASHLSEAGIPPKPDAASSDAYIEALTAIDPDIVHGKPDKAISRGRNQCSSIKDHPSDQARLIQLAGVRFTSPNHPDGFGPIKSEKIVEAVRTHLCPA